MNNSFLEVDSEVKHDPTELLRSEESRLVRILEALESIEDTNEWSTLKIEVFDNLATSLEKALKDEAKKDNPDTNKLNRITGELKWAEKYADLKKLAASYRAVLQNIRLKLHGTTE